MTKIICLICFSVYIIYSMIMDYIDYSSFKRPIPDKVKDIYDEETYKNWKKYKKEKARVSFIIDIVQIAIIFLLFIFNVFSLIANKVPNNVYLQSLVVIGLFLGITLVFSFITDYINTMIIEEKYGFNKTKLKTFITDQIRSFLIQGILITGLLMLFIWLYGLLGYYIILVFIGILCLILLIVMMLYPFIAKMSNKYEDLEEGELRTKLIDLLNKYGFTVRKIEVMLASERTTKSNASFSGFGKTKTIVLYDNLINSMTPDEICAVFAHELGHGLHKDGLKNSVTSLLLVVSIVASLFGLVSFTQLYLDFGFTTVNFGFGFILLTFIVLPYLSNIIQLFSNYISRKAEYKADEQAVIEGYGNELISALKKLTKSNYAELNPNNIIVALTYSHPTVLQRIINIEKQMEKYKK